MGKYGTFVDTWLHDTNTRKNQTGKIHRFNLNDANNETTMIVRTILLLAVIYSHVHAAENGDELGKASSLFTGPVEEVVSEDPRFKWLESPVWHDEGKYLLFSDVKGHRNDADT